MSWRKSIHVNPANQCKSTQSMQIHPIHANPVYLMHANPAKSFKSSQIQPNSPNPCKSTQSTQIHPLHAEINTENKIRTPSLGPWSLKIVHAALLISNLNFVDADIIDTKNNDNIQIGYQSLINQADVLEEVNPCQSSQSMQIHTIHSNPPNP
jgi:hypothetical protein